MKGILPFILILLINATLLAADLADYHQRVELARATVDKLITNGLSAETDRQLAELKVLLPTTEKVEWANGSVETSNAWLIVEIARYTSASGPKEKVGVLSGISERLKTISDDISAVETAAAAAVSKDEEKRKLAEILRRSEYQKAGEKEESLFQKWVRQLREWLSGLLPEPDLQPGTPNSMGSLKMGLQVIVFLLVIGLIGFLVYKFVPYFATRFGERERKTKAGDRIILGERVSAGESAEDLFTEAERLATAGDLRAAIRKGYIAALCELGDRKVLRLARHKTNRDYLRELRQNRRLFDSMTGLTGSFERNWYGLRPAHAEDWEDFRGRYREAVTAARGWV